MSSGPSAPRRRITAIGLAIAAATGMFVGATFIVRGHAPPPPPTSSVPAPIPTRTPPAPEVPKEKPPELPPYVDVDAQSLQEQRRVLLTNMKQQLGIPEDQLTKLAAILEGSDWMGTGNPKVTGHPMTRKECRDIRAKSPVVAADPKCGAPNMVPLFDPSKGETAKDAKACIDQFEFPNIPCEYPITWVQANQAVEMCSIQGKRICDAHEWEGACAGAVHSPDTEYFFGKPRLYQEFFHNKDREVVWAYGKNKDHMQCAMGSRKNPKCIAPTWEECGTNTYPAGAFPKCVSPLGAYDLHGNAAEHMNLPLNKNELASTGGFGETEMKGSWFIFQRYEAHEDDCRWRAPAWHAGKITAKSSHRNYHLGFRCCKDLR